MGYFSSEQKVARFGFYLSISDVVFIFLCVFVKLQNVKPVPL